MKIKELQLYAHSLPELKQFYQNQLACDIIQEDEKSFTSQWGFSTLKFVQTPANYVHPTYHFAFNIPENQLEEARTWLYQQNIPLETSQEKEIIDFPNWNAHALYFKDPSGNILEFIARHDLPNASKDAFTQKSITEISEIGFPVPEIQPFYEAINKHFQIPVYSHISNMTRFCAAGDPNGLFIIVPLERPWFPTDLINGIYPITVKFLGEQAYNQTFENLPYIIESII